MLTFLSPLFILPDRYITSVTVLVLIRVSLYISLKDDFRMLLKMPMTTGRLAVSGKVAYAAQQAWIFNATLFVDANDHRTFGRER